MRIICYQKNKEQVLAAVTDENAIYPLKYKSFMEVVNQSKQQQTIPLSLLKEEIKSSEPEQASLEELTLLVPIEAPEVWASGVTYERSREARNYEATNGKLYAQTFYDKVYDAHRPELFLKSTAARTVGPDKEVYLRSDSEWQIPEPELGLVIDHEGKILAFTLGNDMSCRDIEGENPLYLPQAKIWKQSCSIGPALLLAEAVEDAYQLEMTCRIYRDKELVVEGNSNTSQLKRKYEELVSFLMRDNVIFDGTILLTGTSIVPPNDFSLMDGDLIEIEIPEIGVLRNYVKAPTRKLVSQ